MLETFSEDGIVCPHCGYLEDDSEVKYDSFDDSYTMECGSCDKEMYVFPSVSWSWETKKRGIEDIKEEIKQEEANLSRNIIDSKDFDDWSKEQNIAVRNHYGNKISKLKLELYEHRK